MLGTNKDPVPDIIYVEFVFIAVLVPNSLFKVVPLNVVVSVVLLFVTNSVNVVPDAESKLYACIGPYIKNLVLYPVQIISVPDTSISNPFR